MGNVIHKIIELAIYIGFGFVYNGDRIRMVLHIWFKRRRLVLSPSIRAKELVVKMVFIPQPIRGKINGVIRLLPHKLPKLLNSISILF